MTLIPTETLDQQLPGARDPAKEQAIRVLGYVLIGATALAAVFMVFWIVTPSRPEPADSMAVWGPTLGDPGLSIAAAVVLVLSSVWCIWSLVCAGMTNSFWQLPAVTVGASIFMSLVFAGSGNDLVPVATVVLLTLVFAVVWLVWIGLAHRARRRQPPRLRTHLLELGTLPLAVLILVVASSSSLSVRLPVTLFSEPLEQLARSAPVVPKKLRLQEHLDNTHECVGRLCFDSVGRFPNGLTVLMFEQWTPMFPADGATANALVKSPNAPPTEEQLAADLPPGEQRSIVNVGHDWYFIKWQAYSG